MKIPNSDRLTFQFMTRNDADALFELDQDTEVMKFINGGKMTSMEDILSVSLPRLESYADETEGWGIWKVSLKTPCDDFSSDYLGWVLVRPMDFFTDQPQYHNLELGWRFKRATWGKGFGTEAAKAVMEAVSADEKITTVSALAIENNHGSINIMKKLGMTFLKKEVHRDPLGDMELVFYQKVL